MKKIYRDFLQIASVFLLLLITTTASAQSRAVTGTIADESGAPMPGVNVVIKGTTKGTTTNVQGEYSIEASEDAVLIISFIGYVSQEIRVGNQSRINLTLTEDVATLSEVVVVGYGVQRKSDLTGAISSVDGDNMRTTITATADQALQGRVAGVHITSNSGQPGGAVSVRIRGTSSISASNEPLYVIDGIQVGGSGGGIVGFDWQGGAGGQQGATLNPLASIDPNDIASIEVLKDASATAIYGSRAANGVIIITTKRGKKGLPKLTYSGLYAIQDVYKTLDMMDLPSYAAYNNEVASEVESIAPNERFRDPSLLGPGTDWQAAVFRPAPMQSHSLSLTGGSDATTYMMSAGYFKQDGIIIGSGFERFNTRLNLETKVNDRITIGANISLARRNENITLNDGGDGVISQAAQMPPHIPVRDFDGNFSGPDQQNSSAQIGSNPVALALLRKNTVLNHRLMTNLYGDIKIIKDLNFRSEISVDYNNTKHRSFQPSYKWGRIENPISRLGVRSDDGFFWLWKNYATFNRQLGSHNVTAMVGTEAMKSRWDQIAAFKIRVPNDIPHLNQGEVTNNGSATGNMGWNSLSSYFGRVNYAFGERFLFTGTLRRDGSSRFGPANRWGWFPSASVGYNLSTAGFLASSNVVSNLKLRASWGITGNQEIDNYAFGSALVTENSFFGPTVRNGAYSNPFVKWESTTQYNLGFDLSLLQDRITVTGDVYYKDTDDLLLRVTLPATFGTQVQGPWANVGALENRGVELSVNSVNVNTNNLKWSTAFNFTLNRNKITRMAGTPIREALYWYTGFQTVTVTEVGYPVGQFYGYVMDGIFTSKEEIAAHAVQIPGGPDGTNKIERTTGLWLGDIKWRDINNDGVIDSKDQTVIGDPNPDWSFGLNNTFSHGRFTLDVFVIGTIGGDIMNYTRARNEAMVAIFDNQSMSVNNRAQTRLIEGGTDMNNIDHVELVNPGTKMPRFDNGAENFNHHMSSRWIEDGTFVRIQNLRLAYSIPNTVLSKARISGAMIYANVQNVATFTNYTGLDPQIGAFNQNARRQNIDMGRYPAPRVYTLGVNIEF